MVGSACTPAPQAAPRQWWQEALAPCSLWAQGDDGGELLGEVISVIFHKLGWVFSLLFNGRLRLLC